MNFNAVILAGGASSRMGRPKAALPLNQEPLWQHQARLAAKLGATQVFLSVRDPAPFGSGDRLLVDRHPQLGPLEGIRQGLKRLQAASLLVLAVDMPGLRYSVLTRMIEACTADLGAVPQRPDSSLEPLAAVYPKACLSVLEQCLSEGRRSARQFAARSVAAGLIRPFLLTAAESASFDSVNTPADWQAFVANSPLTTHRG